MDRHRAWCVVVCLIGDGQEINRGEAGIAEWVRALQGKGQLAAHGIQQKERGD
jgi:hypothetical protein